MKTLTRLLVVFVLAFAALTALTSVALGASRLIYADEFNGPLDTTAWANATPFNTHYVTGESEYYDPANCTFANSVMTLKTENRATHGYSYASGIVTSLTHAKFSYGYFEMRAKLPKGPGIWPAFWLTNDSTFEIDGLEMLGDRPTRIYQTLHENDTQIYQGIKDGPDYSAGFHTYGIDWQPTYIKWYIDGVLTTTYNNASVPSDPMWICINTAVGGAWQGLGLPTAATQFPTTFDIDYVHVYDTKPAAQVAPVTPAAPTTPVTPMAPVTVPTDPTTPTAPVVSPDAPVYRFYNKRNGTHFYTASAAERDNVEATLGTTYRLDGVAYEINGSNGSNDAPLYRFYDVKTGTHFFTVSEAEKNAVVANLSSAYRLEGVAYDVSTQWVPGATTVYRFYNKRTGTHFFTASEVEKDDVVANLSATYRLDGPAFYLAP